MSTLDNVILLGDRILVNPLRGDTKSAGGIVLPEGLVQTQIVAEVLKVGPGGVQHGIRLDMTVKVGDLVVYSPKSGMPIAVGQDEFVLLGEANVLAILRE